MSEGPAPVQKPPQRLPLRVLVAGLLAGAVVGGAYRLIAHAFAGPVSNPAEPLLAGAIPGSLLGCTLGQIAAWTVRSARAQSTKARLALGALVGGLGGGLLFALFGWALLLMMGALVELKRGSGESLPSTLALIALWGGVVGLVVGLISVWVDRPAAT